MKVGITLFTVLLACTIVQTQIFNIDEIDPVVIPTKPFKKPINGEISILVNNSADCFQGSVTNKVNQGNTFESTYVACFVPIPSCNYTRCHKGFIANYTSSETGVIQGFPSNRQAVFRLDVISAANYSIQKSANLSPELNQIIDIASYQFDPTVASPPRKPSYSTPVSPVSVLSKATAPSSTSKTYNLLNGQKYEYTDAQQKTYIPSFSFKASGNNIYSATAPTQKLALSEIEGDAAQVNRAVKYDATNSIIQERSDIVDLKFVNNLGQGSNAGPSNLFQGKISLSLNKLGEKQSYSSTDLDAALSRITTVFTLADLEKQRTTQSLQFKAFPQEDKIESPKEVIPPNGKKIGNLDKVLDNRDTKRSFLTELNPDILNPSNSNLRSRLLPQVILFNQQYPLYQRTVFGKTIKVSILVVAKLVDNQLLVITGTIRLDFFGKKKDIVIFNRQQNVNFNWSYSHTFSGAWSFNIYIPLPPPVSFIGINFGFSVGYSIPINLSATGSATAADFYRSTFLANISASVGVDASAAVRVIAVEGGVFIKGTLVSIRTDPRLVLTYYYGPRRLNVALSWYFYFKPFTFNWGFFWRYWRLFRGWSRRIIIAQWSISNPPEKSYPILNFSRDYYF